LESNYLEARGALEALREGDSRLGRKTVVARISDLEREKNGLADVYARLLRAGLAALGPPGPAREAFQEAESKCIELKMPLHELACAQRRAALAGDHERAARAEAKLSRMGVRAPSRFIDMLAPRSGRVS